jgi:double-stranded uracil-DNA glycosylase
VVAEVEAGVASAPGREVDDTIAVYEARAAEWLAERRATNVHGARAVAERTVAGHPVLDLGCGPGWHLSHLGPSTVALDAARAMLDLVPDHAPGAGRVQADLRSLPFRMGAFGGAWASRSYVHLPRPEVPLALADLHRTLAVGAPATITVFIGDEDLRRSDGDRFTGRAFSRWDPDHFARVMVGAGFSVDRIEADPPATDERFPNLAVEATRLRTLADTVGPGIRLLVCGLNPSIYSADAGVGFARPGNRFWPAALAAGIVSRPRDPRHALLQHGMGMTNLVMRATRRADELDAEEYREGVERVRRLVEWLPPAALCMVGLSGWRTAVDRKAVAGVQAEAFGGRPVYLMPNTSGLNAHSRPADLAVHLRAAAALADSSA